MSTNPPEDKPTVTVERRRRTGPESGRQRAEAPERQQGSSGSGGGRPSSGSSGGSSGGLGSGLPGGRKLPIGVVLLLVVCYVAYTLIFGGNKPPEEDTSLSQPIQVEEQTQPVEAPLAAAPTHTPRPKATSTPAVAGGATSANSNQRWLVILYQDADDKILEQDIYVDLNEAERVGSSQQVQIVAQVDRYRAGYQGDGDWISARRYHITQDDSLNRVSSEMVEDLGEVNMSDASTLVDFVAWAASQYPADKYVLILSDHGMGWPGGWSDASPEARDDSGTPLGSALGDELYLQELDQALADIRSETGIQQFELIGMDACLMAHVEVFSMLAQHARYAVASQETEPALGWAYSSFLANLNKNPAIDGAELGQLIVDSYIQDDQRIVDDQARSEFLRQGSPLGGLFGSSGGISSRQLAEQISRGITLTAADLTQFPALLENLNNFVYNLQEIDQDSIAQARTYAQSFTNIFGSSVPASYIDLGHFAQLLGRESGSNQIAQAAGSLMDALDSFVVAEKHGPQKPGATGVSIYFPNSRLYGSPTTGPESYNVIARRFVEQSLWDDFLAYHYSGKTFEPDTSAPPAAASGNQRAPGAGQIEVGPVSLSAKSVAPREEVTLSADISGQNIGYIKLFVGYFDQASNSIYVADSDYLESAETRELDGIYYPVWPETESFRLEYAWEPVVFGVSDGQQTITVLFNPESYGATFVEAVYTLDGIYTYADDGQTRPARLYFQNGKMQSVYGFTGEAEGSAPRQIIPQTGDTFTVLENWLDLDVQGQVSQTATQEGGTLTFTDQMFTWVTQDAASGNYIIGLLVEDMDGNTYPGYTQIGVR
jgi:hypothetical protein